MTVVKTIVANVPRPRFVPIDSVNFPILTGAAGWIDTDVSAVTGTNASRIWFISALQHTAAGQIGARVHGSALAPLTPAVAGWTGATLLACCDSTGHMDLYRNAGGDVDYQFIGYMDA